MKILFVGNSYTYFNDMPKLLEQLMQANGHPAEVIWVTKGGRKLFQNLELEDETAEKLKAVADGSHHFDAVFLQEQSYLPVVDYELFAKGVRGTAELLRPYTDRFIMYQTWGRRDDHPLLAERGWTHEGMADDLADAYGRVAEEIGAAVSPVGRAFTRVYRSHPEIELYKEDRYHPSYIGSCLAAITHYEALLGEKPKVLSPLELSEEVLKILV